MTRIVATFALFLTLSAFQVSAQPGCQPRIQVMNSWVMPSDGPWSASVTYGPGYFGPGYLFDYPAGANRTTIVSFSAQVMRFNASGQPKPNGGFVATPSGVIQLEPDAVQFYGYYWGNANQSWKVARDFGPRADASLNFQLTPFDQFWAAASNAYPDPVWVRWLLHVVVC